MTASLFFILLGSVMCFGLAAAGWLWLWFMLARPEKWSAFVDMENDFWMKQGLPASLTEFVKKIEKGIIQKILVGTGAGIFTLLFFFSVPLVFLTALHSI